MLKLPQHLAREGTHRDLFPTPGIRWHFRWRDGVLSYLATNSIRVVFKTNVTCHCTSWFIRVQTIVDDWSP